MAYAKSVPDVMLSCPLPSERFLPLTARGGFLTLREFRQLCSTTLTGVVWIGVRGWCACKKVAQLMLPASSVGEAYAAERYNLC